MIIMKVLLLLMFLNYLVLKVCKCRTGFTDWENITIKNVIDTLIVKI